MYTRECSHLRPQLAVHDGPGSPVLIFVGRVFNSGSGTFGLVVGYGWGVIMVVIGGQLCPSLPVLYPKLVHLVGRVRLRSLTC